MGRIAGPDVRYAAIHAFWQRIGTPRSGRPEWPQLVSRKTERQQPREAVANYHLASLAELVAHVADAVDQLRDGEIDAFDVDQVLVHHSRAAKELWKFCNMVDVQMAAHEVRRGLSIDWWERAAPRPR